MFGDEAGASSSRAAAAKGAGKMKPAFRLMAPRSYELIRAGNEKCDYQVWLSREI